MSPPVDVPALVAAARDRTAPGHVRAVARLISLVEAEPAGDDRALREVMAALAPHTGHAHVVGITGPPGVGKSTLTSALVAAVRESGRRAAVLAVDPSSPFTGGALLGDRIRMQQHATDAGVFIRSMATRGRLGGLSWAAPAALRVLDAGGFEVIMVETVGVGQSEVDVAAQADTTVVVLAPGMGDGVQAAKAGILEVGDVFVVNKADQDGADAAVRDLRQMLALAQDLGPGRWRPPVLRTVAAHGEGVPALLTQLGEHLAWARDGGSLQARRVTRAGGEIESLVLAALRTRGAGLAQGSGVRDLAADVVAGRLDPYAAADRLLEGQMRPAGGGDPAQP